MRAGNPFVGQCRRPLGAVVAVALTALVMAAMAMPAWADTIKVGVIGPFSGPFALSGKNFKAGIDAWFALNGTSVGPHQVEVVYRDVEAPDPARSKNLAQELVVKEKVQYLAGFYFTPDALAAAPLLSQADVPMVIFNAATSAITQKSPLIVRTSFTLAQISAPMARVAAQRGIRKVVTAVTDYGPGIDSEAAFKTTFEEAGGTIAESIRMPIKTNDFSPIMQRVRDSGAEAVFAFLPSGPPTLSFVKAFNDAGLKGKIKLLGTGDITPEPDLPALGDAALGILTTSHYAVSHASPENEAFVAAAEKAIGNADELAFPAVGAFDGMRLIYRMIEATGGKKDATKAVAAVKDFAWTSPRGPVRIDPETRTITQTIYLREVAKVDGKIVNKEIEGFPDQPDFGLVGAK